MNGLIHQLPCGGVLSSAKHCDLGAVGSLPWVEDLRIRRLCSPASAGVRRRWAPIQAVVARLDRDICPGRFDFPRSIGALWDSRARSVVGLSL